MHRFLAISLSTFLLTAPTFAQLAANTSIVGKVADVTGDRYHAFHMVLQECPPGLGGWSSVYLATVGFPQAPIRNVPFLLLTWVLFPRDPLWSGKFSVDIRKMLVCVRIPPSF